MIRSMHRMYVEAELIVSGHNPMYYYDATQFTGSSYGAWRALFSAPGLSSAGSRMRKPNWANHTRVVGWQR